MRVLRETSPKRVKATLAASETLDHTNAMICREEVVGALAPGGRLVLDLGTVQTIDSAGVGALVAVLKAVRRTGGRMVLIGLHPRVLSVLKTIRLTTVFEIHSDEATALASLESTPVTSR
jgi:anti-sigma B factor antagonist